MWIIKFTKNGEKDEEIIREDRETGLFYLNSKYRIN